VSRVIVVGAGVIGLTCAVELEAAGHDVTVIGERTADATVSSVAGAIWFPYRVGPPDRVARWAARTARASSSSPATPTPGSRTSPAWRSRPPTSRRGGSPPRPTPSA